LDETFT
jgi:hypothetical protein